MSGLSSDYRPPMDYLLGTTSNKGAHGIPGPNGTAHGVHARFTHDATAEAICGQTVFVWRGRHFPKADENCGECMSRRTPPPPPLEPPPM
jgi:hypothetical protein